MSNNKYYLEIINQIIEIQNNQFEIKTLRKALEITNKTAFLYNQSKLSKKEFNNINNFLKETIENKLLELNNKLSKSTLNKICKCYNREYICLPNDITIINNDIVFYQENYYDNPYYTNIILLNDNSKNKFNTIKKTETIPTKNIESANQLTNYINNILKPFFKSKSPILSLKKNILESNSIELFTYPNLNYIIDNISQYKDITFNLIATSEWNDFYYFKINIRFSKDKKSTQWSLKLIKPDIWNLNNELEKQNNNKHILKKTK